MHEKIMIWTINAAEEILENKKFKIRNIFKLKNCDFGNRRAYTGNLNTNNLMPDEEYFVPIPVKCIGSKFEEKNLDRDGKKILDGIKKYYKKLDMKEYQRFWSEGCGPKNRSKMLTENFIGYYEILEKAGNEGYKNILIGYSQGGLVARYLAFLDEYIFKKNVIKGIITISSPNFGSPLANYDNNENIINGLIEIIWSFFSFYKKYNNINGFADIINWTEDKINFEHITEILERMLNGAIAINSKELIKFFTSAIKWLGGLSGDKNNAFYDLNILNMNANNYSALSLINKNEYRLNNILYGSIISTDNRIDSVLISLLKENLGLILIPFAKCFLKIKIILNKSILQNFNKASKTYKKRIMKEQIKKSNIKQIIKDKIYDYNNGNNQLNISQQAHDFVIPSSYQILLDNDKNNFLGNKINKYANHNSGKSCGFKGGRINFKYIKRFLIEMKKK